MSEKRKRGRPRIGKIRDFRMSDTEWSIFKEWCAERNLEASEVIRVLLKHFSSMDLKQHLMFILEKYSDEELEKLKEEMKKNERI